MPGVSGLTVVTGGAGALGRAVVDEFLARGGAVVAMDRDGERLHEVGALDGVTAVAVDLADRDAVDAAWERVDGLGGSVASLVCVAGGFAGGSLDDTDAATVDAMLGGNVTSALWSCRAAARRMRAAGGGAIVTIGSRAGAGGPGPVAYAAAKAAVIRMTAVLADELRDDGVRVNCVLPSVIDTPANRSWMTADAVARAVPPAAIARVVAFLCSADAAPVSGAALPVYGRA